MTVIRCRECAYDWDSGAEDAVAVVRDLPAKLSRLLGAVNAPDARLRARPAPEVWSPLEYVAHTGEAIAWYARRINRLLTEHRPVLAPFDWDAHTANQRYHDHHLDDVLDDVSRSCTTFTAMLADLSAVEWQREGLGSDSQPRTVTQLAHRAAHEAHHHLRDIEAALSLPG